MIRNKLSSTLSLLRLKFQMLTGTLKHMKWCGFPKRKCTCSRGLGLGYKQLLDDLEQACEDHSGESSTSYSEHETKPPPRDKSADLPFYNDDGSSQKVLVEKNLCASDLCQLLAMKNRVPKSIHWSIIQKWSDLGLERVLEDHEHVLTAYRDMQEFSYHSKCHFIFRKDFSKYDFFYQPQQFFPSDMLNIENENDDEKKNRSQLQVQNLATQEGQCPVIFSYVWVRDDERRVWSKMYMLLRDKKLFTSQNVQCLARFLRTPKNKAIEMINENTEISNDIQLFAKLSDYHVYTALNAKNQFRAPSEWGICLRLIGYNTDDEISDPLRCLACDSERVRSCWITAMRLAKYGKQLRENYRAFKNKQTESMNSRDYNSYSVPNESIRSRVAMDFTGAVGRIVEDPHEANAIAVAEGYSWKRRWRPSPRGSTLSAVAQASAHIQTLDATLHIGQPWYHGAMTRDHAASLVAKHGNGGDGVFLVRESRSNPGSYVLTYKCGGKILHAQISKVLDQLTEYPVYSLDSGVTKFYDILQLVEFYQLNAGCLPTRLTHYVVQSPNTVVSVATAAQREQVPQPSTSAHRSSGGSSN